MTRETVCGRRTVNAFRVVDLTAAGREPWHHTEISKIMLEDLRSLLGGPR